MLPQELSDRQKYQDMLAQDSIVLGHNIIQALHSSDLWWDAFGDYIKEGNKHSYWDTWHNDGRIEKVKIDAIQLICNVKTWWGSVYHMVCHL